MQLGPCVLPSVQHDVAVSIYDYVGPMFSLPLIATSFSRLVLINFLDENTLLTFTICIGDLMLTFLVPCRTVTWVRPFYT